MDRYVKQVHSTITESNMQMSNIQVHPEESGNDKINTALQDGFIDIVTLDNNMKNLANKIDDLFNRSISRLDTVADIITAEKERLQDITMLCNDKTDYDNAIPLTDKDFTGDFTFENNAFHAKDSKSIKVNAAIIEVTGNGYEGNKYVLQNNDYLEKILSTNRRRAVTDNNISTYWEYSRITASNTEEYLISDFHKDSSEAKCTITFKFNQLTNEAVISSSLQQLKVTNIRYSNDGLDYTDLDILPFTLNNKTDSYKNQGYIYGSNVIAFPNCLYLKITFESTGYLNDTIAFERSVTDNDKINTTTHIVKTAKRHVIRLNDITFNRKTYELSSVFKTNDLVKDKEDIYAISVFANVYLPQGTIDKNVKFSLTINGIEYNVVPINSYKDGIKIIRFSQGKMPAEYTKYIGEKITSAYLTIKINSKEKITPYVNNIKILLGGKI